MSTIAEIEKNINDARVIQRNDKGKFRFQNQKAMFTYRGHLNKEDVVNFFTKLNKNESPKFIRIAHENGMNDPNTPYEHSHVVVDFGNILQTTNARKFDMDVDGVKIHPHIQALSTKRHWENSMNYLAKEDPDNADLMSDTVEQALRGISGCKTLNEAYAKNMKMKGGKLDFSSALGIKTIYEGIKEKRTIKCIPPSYPWAKELYDEITKNKGDNRKIIWYVDYIGNSGKTQFERYMSVDDKTGDDWFCVKDMGNESNASTIIKNALDNGWTGKGIIIDLPRTVSDAQSRIYQYLESIRDGHVTATKYQGGNEYYDIDYVIVFANWMPIFNKMSTDRWDIRLINSKKECIKLTLGEARRINEEHEDEDEEYVEPFKEKLMENRLKKGLKILNTVDTMVLPPNVIYDLDMNDVSSLYHMMKIMRNDEIKNDDANIRVKTCMKIISEEKNSLKKLENWELEQAIKVLEGALKSKEYGL